MLGVGSPHTVIMKGDTEDLRGDAGGWEENKLGVES